jgi:hypothetical protein
MTRHGWLNVGIVLIGVFSGVALSAKPWQVYKEQRLAADKEIAEMQKSEANRERLVREDAKYKSSLGREELARKEGYRKRGEVAVR